MHIEYAESPIELKTGDWVKNGKPQPGIITDIQYTSGSQLQVYVCWEGDEVEYPEHAPSLSKIDSRDLEWNWSEDGRLIRRFDGKECNCFKALKERLASVEAVKEDYKRVKQTKAIIEAIKDKERQIEYLKSQWNFLMETNYKVGDRLKHKGRVVEVDSFDPPYLVTTSGEMFCPTELERLSLTELMRGEKTGPETDEVGHKTNDDLVNSDDFGDGLSQVTFDRSLQELESVIESGLRSFFEVGIALSEVRDRKLYKEKNYSSFEVYCKERWGFGRDYAYKQIGAAEVMSNLISVDNCRQNQSENNCLHLIPQNEAQVRPLTKLDPELQKEAWQRAIATAPDGKITAIHIEQTVKQMKREKLNSNCQKSPVNNPPPLPKFKEGDRVKVRPADVSDEELNVHKHKLAIVEKVGEFGYHLRRGKHRFVVKWEDVHPVGENPSIALRAMPNKLWDLILSLDEWESEEEAIALIVERLID